MVARPAGPFPYYPVTADTLRASVEDMHRRAQRLAAVISHVDKTAQPALSAVEGIFAGLLEARRHEVGGRGSVITAKAVFAAGTVQLFADGVDAFDSSVAAMNVNIHAVRIRAGQPGEQGVDVDAVTASWLPDYQRAEADLDAVALQVSSMLQRGPNEADIKSLWADGNLPESAALVWPEWLKYSQLKALPADLDQMTPDELARYLAKLAKDHPYLARLLGRQAPEAYALMLAKYGDFALTADGNRFDPRRATRLLPGVCGPGPGGILIGPDGLPYPVMVPQTPTSDGPVISRGGPIPDMAAGGWRTTASRTGDIQIGDEGGLRLGLAFFLAGDAAPDQARHSVGTSQQQYLRFAPDGTVSLVDQDQVDRAKPPGGDDMPTIDGPDESGLAGRDGARETYNRTANSINLGTDVLRAVDNVKTYDANRSYAYQVVFQEDPAGIRRAVIVLNQLEPDDNGHITVQQYVGAVKSDGSIGSPYEG